MNEFTLKGENGSIRLRLDNVIGVADRPGRQSGYAVFGSIEIHVQSYHVASTLRFSTDRVCEFFDALMKAHDVLDGSARFVSSEHELDLTIEYQKRGQVCIRGSYQTYPGLATRLTFEIISDQSFIASALSELEEIVRLYPKKVKENVSAFIA